MSSEQLVVVLGVAAVGLAIVASLRRAGIPAPVVLVLVGLVIGFLPFVPDASLHPHVVLLGLLPLLVYDAAVTASPTAFRRDAPSIGLLAVPLVVVTSIGVAVVVHSLGDVSWSVAFVLGTAVGPTDAAAATAIARRLGLPRRLVTILEGEALFNDATALVLYAAAIAAATTGHFSVAHTAVSVLYAVVAGAAIGGMIGLVGRWLRNRVDDPPIEIAASILLAYLAYVPAEAIHASGVLAAVTAGLYLGWHSSGSALSAHSRLQSAAFWETMIFLVNAALFVLVGLSFHTFTTQARGSVGHVLATGAAVVATVIVLRLVWMWGFRWVVRPHRQQSLVSTAPGWRARLTLGWAGMRGAITLAALLAVPTVNRAGQPIVGRDDIIYVGFELTLVSLVLQGLTLPALVRRLGLRENPTVADAERQARIALTRATLRYLAAACDVGQRPEEIIDGLRAQYDRRLLRLEATDDDNNLDVEAAANAAADLSLRRDLIDFQRRELGALRQKGVVGTTSLRTLERELDLEETRLGND